MLSPLCKLAARRRVAVIGNNHLHKGDDDDNPIYRAMGSIAFVAASRSSWLVTADPQDKDRRLFTKIKNNLATKDVGGLAFRIAPAPGGVSWGKERVATTAHEALRVERADSAPAKTEAKDMLVEMLKDGPQLADEVWSRAKADRMCEKTVRTAAKEMGIRIHKTGGPGTPWQWSLPKTKKTA
jgi:hypothetical protein